MVVREVVQPECGKTICERIEKEGGKPTWTSFDTSPKEGVAKVALGFELNGWERAVVAGG